MRIMKMNEIGELVTQLGVGGICLAYMIYDNLTTKKQMLTTLTELRDLIQKLVIKMEDYDKKIGKLEEKEDE
jgi:hypothetical protein